MRFTKIIALVPAFFLLFSCEGNNPGKKSLSTLTLDMARKSLAEKYPKLPTDEILRQANGDKLYKDLQERYKQSLRALATETDRDGVKLVVLVMSPNVGKSLTLANTYGIPFITQSCNMMGIEYVDMTPAILAQKAEAISQMASDDNWSKEGAAFVGEQFSYLMTGYDCFKNGKKFPPGPKPATFGDMPPNENEVIDADKNVKYHITTNSQGLRMDHDLTFPKKKIRILFMGNTGVSCPELDDKLIPTYLLQQKYPAKEIINAGFQNYTIEDFLDLYMQKARFTEPDILVVCTSGEDILNYFFTQRNRYSRIQKVYRPSDNEVEFYEHLN